MEIHVNPHNSTIVTEYTVHWTLETGQYTYLFEYINNDRQIQEWLQLAWKEMQYLGKIKAGNLASFST
jgi:hypothetical protein